jgi:hypothetical protein
MMRDRRAVTTGNPRINGHPAVRDFARRKIPGAAVPRDEPTRGMEDRVSPDRRRRGCETHKGVRDVRFSPCRGATGKPRATPRGPRGDTKASLPRRGGTGRPAAEPVSPFQGERASGRAIPRALPWAFLFGPFRARAARRGKANPRRAGLVFKHHPPPGRLALAIVSAFETPRKRDAGGAGEVLGPLFLERSPARHHSDLYDRRVLHGARHARRRRSRGLRDCPRRSFLAPEGLEDAFSVSL